MEDISVLVPYCLKKALGLLWGNSKGCPLPCRAGTPGVGGGVNA